MDDANPCTEEQIYSIQGDQINRNGIVERYIVVK